MLYLYLKKHKKTGKKYLGYTQQDPFEYVGSGKLWLQHLKKYGREVETEILFTTESMKELSEKGIEFSNKFDVVGSDDFLNLMEESGTGCTLGTKRSEETRTKMREVHSGHNRMSEDGKRRVSRANSGSKNGMFGRTHSKEAKEKIRQTNYNRVYKPHSEETKRKISETLKARKNT